MSILNAKDISTIDAKHINIDYNLRDWRLYNIIYMVWSLAALTSTTVSLAMQSGACSWYGARKKFIGLNLGHLGSSWFWAFKCVVISKYLHISNISKVLNKSFPLYLLPLFLKFLIAAMTSEEKRWNMVWRLRIRSNFVSIASDTMSCCWWIYVCIVYYQFYFGSFNYIYSP